MTPTKFLRTAFGIRGLSSTYISKVFLRTEMALKSRNVLGTRSLARSRSSDNLPSSHSQMNIQMMSNTLTIREVISSCRFNCSINKMKYIMMITFRLVYTCIAMILSSVSVPILPASVNNFFMYPQFTQDLAIQIF